MRTRNSRKVSITAMVAAAATAFMSTGNTARAQWNWDPPGTPTPPAEGPPPATLSSPHSVQPSFYTDVVALAIQRGLDKANTKLGGKATFSFSADTSSPYMLATGYRDRPNEFYANVPYNLTYTGYIQPLGPSLTITQSTNVQFSCEGWQTGSGLMTSKIVFDPAYFDPSQYSNVITAALQPQIQAAVNALPLGPVSLPFSALGIPQPCGTLGAFTKAQAGFDAISWDNPLPVHFCLPIRPCPAITVRVLQVTRLALDDKGAPVYNAVETPYLQFWADYSFLSLTMPPMVEGQTFTPANAVVQTPMPTNGQLVLIANMQYSGLQLPIGQTDSAYAVFGQAANFGNGVWNFETPKTYHDVIFFGRPILTTTTAGGYEVTIQISGGCGALPCIGGIL